MSDSCVQCSRCCRHLYLYDRIIISWYFKMFQISKTCKILNREGKCSWHSIRPKLCKEWKCGANHE